MSERWVVKWIGTCRFPLLYVLGGVFFYLVVASCSEPPGPRQLTPEELSRVEVDGGVSKWLPIRFSADVVNGNSELELVELEFEVAGYVRQRTVRIAPGETRRVRLQYIFPEDEGWDDPLDPEAPWRLRGATGVVVEP